MDDWKVSKLLKQHVKYGKMSHESRIELFKQYEQDKQNGIPPEESVARTVLILGNEDLIPYTMIHFLEGFDYVQDDSEIYAYGKVALIDAIDHFDLKKETSFSTLAVKAILHKMYLAIKRLDKKNIVSLFQLYHDNGNIREYEIPDPSDFVKDVTDKISNECLKREIVSNFKYLTEKEQNILIRYFGLCGANPTSCQIISKQIGVGRQASYFKLYSGIDKLKLLMSKKILTEDEQIKLKRILNRTYPLLPEVKEYLEKAVDNLYN